MICAVSARTFVRPDRLTCAAPAGVVLTDPALLGGAFLLGHPPGARPPIVTCGICPLSISSRDPAPFGMGLTPLRGPLGRLRNTALTLIINRVVFPPVERIAEQIFHRLHGHLIPFAAATRGVHRLAEIVDKLLAG